MWQMHTLLSLEVFMPSIFIDSPPLKIIDFTNVYCSWIVYKNILFKNYNCLICNYKKIKNKIMMYGYDSTIMLKTLPSITFFIKETAWKSRSTMQIPFWGLLRQLCIWNIDSTEKDLLFHISLNLRG